MFLDIMLDFFFFNQEPCNKFTQFVQGKGIATHSSKDKDGFILAISEDTDDVLVESFEVFYDQMLDLDRDIFEQSEAESESVSAGVTLNLSSGKSVQAEVSVSTLNKLLSVLDTHELSDFVNAIVDAVENPPEASLCCRVLDT